MLVSRFSICVSAALVFAFSAVPSRAATCTNASLHGNYAFTANGVTLPALGLPAPLTGPFASSGMATFDGNGNFSLTAVSSFNGAVGAPATVTGTYSVNSGLQLHLAGHQRCDVPRGDRQRGQGTAHPPNEYRNSDHRGCREAWRRSDDR